MNTLFPLNMKKKVSVDDFWLNNPRVLIEQNAMNELWPNEKMSLNGKLNAISRLIILLSLVGFLLTRSTKILVSGIVTLVVLVFIYYIKSDREGFVGSATSVASDPSGQLSGTSSVSDNLNKIGEEYSEVSVSDEKVDMSKYYKLNMRNPLGNVLLPEIGDDPKRKPAPPTFDTSVESIVNNATRKMTQDLHPNIQNLDKRLFHDLGDKFEFENSMIHFNTMPSTTIPNAQTAFAEFCYGNMESCKDNTKSTSSSSCGQDPPRVGSIVG